MENTVADFIDFHAHTMVKYIKNNLHTPKGVFMKKINYIYTFLFVSLIFTVGTYVTVAAYELQGFDKKYYLSEKLKALQNSDPYWLDKNVVNLEMYLKDVGFTPEQHYLKYGSAEGLNPNEYFNRNEYSLAKSIDMYKKGGYYTIEEAKKYFEIAWPFDNYIHYIKYGAAEGINPSNLFDESSYLTDKLNALRSENDEWNDKDIIYLRNYLSLYKFTVIDHYLEYGINEGLKASPVPIDEQVLIYTVAAPANIKVSFDNIDDYCRVSWDASTTTDANYILQEATDINFTNNLRDVYYGTGIESNISNLTPKSTYYYRIMAVRNGYTNSPWKTADNGCLVQETATTRRLPDKFIGIFLPLSPIAGEGQFDYISRTVKNAKNNFQIDVINLLVNWNDIHISDSTIDINSVNNLNRMIKEIKDNGCYCILRIYTNQGGFSQAWPSFLEGRVTKTYNSPSRSNSNIYITNPLPWDNVYYSSYTNFLNQLTTFFTENNFSYPDAVQLTVGGDFGEQILKSYPDTSESFYNNILFPVQKEHITDQIFSWSNKIGDKIVMVNNLVDDNQYLNTSVGNFALSSGVKWIQTNQGSCALTSETSNFLNNITHGKNIILEDTETNHCLEDINNIENKNGILFSGVIIHNNLLTPGNSNFISNLRSYIINRQ